MMLDEIRALQGSVVGVSLADNTRLDDATVLGVVAGKIWLHAGNRDVFVPVSDVVDVWPSAAHSGHHRERDGPP